MATSRRAPKRKKRYASVGKCTSVGAEIKAKGDSARARRRRSHGGYCLVKTRKTRPVKATKRLVLSAAEMERRRKRRAAAKKRAAAAVKRTTAKKRAKR